MKFFAPLVFLCLICAIPVRAQQLHSVQGQLLIQPRPGASIEDWIARHQSYRGQGTQLRILKQVSKPANIWLVSYDYTRVPGHFFLQAAARSRDIAHIQYNHLVSLRSTVPDDPLFDQQWQYINTGQSGGLIGADIDADLAWDITTGGLTPDGDTIVVCAIDGGLDLNHDDFGDNHWRNWSEIPNNGIDDDNNGYVDDFLGWNINTDNDDIQDFGGHGTAVAGIIGAKGNNGLGVAGINWDVKVMVIKNDFNANEAEVLEAYSYALSARKRYNETNGSEGAFVVATNASWGIDFGQPEDSPLWCAFYDSLGQAGILNCGATINGNQNVDEVGDLPTACPSDFLISVTNMNDLDQKVQNAGFGLTTIDLGAPGENAFTTNAGNGYDGFGGTSGATPHVAGTIGLLYSAPCPNLAALTRTDPAAAALLVRQAVLEGVDPNSSLDGITVTGGRLNVNGSLQALLLQCGGCLPPVSIELSAIVDTSVQVSWNIIDSVEEVNLRYRPFDGQQPGAWDTLLQVSSPFVLGGLSACTEYELQFQSVCDDEASEFTSARRFRTEGCCEPPATINLALLTDSSAISNWSPVFGATGYILRYRPVGASGWTELPSITPGVAINGLQACTEYELQVRTTCAAGSDTEWSLPVRFTTFGCGACLDLSYCPAEGFNTRDEWIDSIRVHTLTNASGDDDGYGDFTGSEPPLLEQGSRYAIHLAPGFSGIPFEEFFRIWIDLDQNGSFGPDEVVFSSGEASELPVSDSLTIPVDALPGLTRMRIGMKFLDLGPAETCGPIGTDFGEMEDYCVEIIAQPPACPAPQFAGEVSDSESVTYHWLPVPEADQYQLTFTQQNGPDVQTFTTSDTTFTVFFDQLDTCSTYRVEVATQCGGVFSAASAPEELTTSCINSTRDPLGDEGIVLQVQPNPAHGGRITYRLRLTENQEQADLELWSLDGRLLRRQSGLDFPPGETLAQLETGGLPTGIYLLRLRLADGRFALRRVMLR